MNRLTAGNWRCDVCLRDRKYDDIGVAKHSSTNAQGVTVEHNVKYCRDSDTCRRIAHVRNHTELAHRRLQGERDGLRAALTEWQEKLVWQRAVFAFVAFIAGFVIRGGI